jgi:FAD:protein FMN transferase
MVMAKKRESNTEPESGGLERHGADYRYGFRAMATPCEVRVATNDPNLALCVARAVEAEARRIEGKFSRYREDSVIGRINARAGAQTIVDPETAHLLDFAAESFCFSGGLFDVTSGVLRHIWRFDGGSTIPSPEAIVAAREYVGWEKVRWESPAILLPTGMEIDLGGIAKEYAVDRALAAVRAITPAPALVNFGGDLCVSGPPRSGRCWQVAIESVDAGREIAGLLSLPTGAIATSGDAHRFLISGGIRYGHILDPRSGKPVMGAPRSVTVAAASCVEAGMFATLAVLHGPDAEGFLEREGVRAWCIR